MNWFASLGPAAAGWPSAVIPEVVRFAVNSGPLSLLGLLTALVPGLLVLRQAVGRPRLPELPRLRVLEGRKVLGRRAA